jgi:peptidyl-prolyl cis-trans isomerase A (cyclophilin A)
MKKLLVLALCTFTSFAALAANPKVVIKTSKGDIEVELFEDKSPITVKNFLSYVDKGYYKGTIFHRVINDFMIQGGGFDKNMSEKKSGAPIKNEATNGLKNETGTLAMARTNVIDSATAQFFINVVDNESLNHHNMQDGYGYAVFGKVTSGMPVVNMIKLVKVGTRGPHENVPTEPVVILDITKKK